MVAKKFSRSEIQALRKQQKRANEMARAEIAKRGIKANPRIAKMRESKAHR